MLSRHNSMIGLSGTSNCYLITKLSWIPSLFYLSRRIGFCWSGRANLGCHEFAIAKKKLVSFGIQKLCFRRSLTIWGKIFSEHGWTWDCAYLNGLSYVQGLVWMFVSRLCCCYCSVFILRKRKELKFTVCILIFDK